MIERVCETAEVEKIPASAEWPKPPVCVLPPDAVVVEIMAKRFREELDRRGARDWRIFCGGDEVLDVDVVLKEPESFGEENLTLEPLSLTGSLPQPGYLWFTYEEGKEEARESPMGFLWLETSGVAVARWVVWNPAHSFWARVGMLAAESLEKINLLRRRVAEVERRAKIQEWRVVGAPREESWSRDWHYGWEQILISEGLRHRLEDEVIGFFSPRARQLYASLGVPYRRGVLLYGPPGNGKTSIIRVLGGALPAVTTMTLQPHAEFNDDDLKRVLRHWARHAPAMLVIEDIDSIFQNEKIHVSKFLNMLDGITQPCNGGVLLVATTNYPDRLDRAINNRPGRFDVVVEIPSPDRQSREDYLSRICGDVDPELLERLVSGTDAMSFAHLAEILRVSGFRAIRGEREVRTGEDWLEALEAVKTCNQAARSGFECSGTGAYGFSAAR